MFFPRPLGRTAIVWLSASALFIAPAVLAAQAPTSVPAPVPGSSLPSVPAPTPQQTPGASVPAPTPPSQTPTAVRGYQDPLQTPIVVAPGPDVPPLPPPQPQAASLLPSYPPYDPASPEERNDHALGSAYIPVDSPVYPMALRLYSMGYLDTAFLNMRPWTRLSLLHMLHASSEAITSSGNDEAMDILAKLEDYVATESTYRGTVYGLDTVYTRLLGINGQSLRDSFHLGQTINNDYGRPYQSGFNAIAGFSSLNEYGRFSLYVRGEYQHSPSGAGYSQDLSSQLSTIDQIPFSGSNLNQATIPTGPLAAQNPFRLLEATLSFHVLGHEISGGKSDAWLGPGMGGAMAWSNNAENIYSFRINRVEPLHIPFVSRVLGPLRYDFFVGSLKGHTYPNDPWVHSEMFAFAPTSNFQFGFQRTVIWGGQDHEPITIHTFLRSFFDFNDTEADPSQKQTAQDPGARFSVFNFSWRLPYLSHYVTLYADTIAHDDVSPISAPRRAAYRPGLYLSHVPGIPKLDFRVEAASTDTSTLRSLGGQFNYYETIQRQGYTNKGFILGDWIGREAKGGQAWLTYHLSGNEWIQLEYLDKKTPKDFIPGGTTQGQFMVDVVKRLRKDVELNAWVQYERWKAPIYMTGQQSDTTIAAQVTWYPKLRASANLNGK